MKGLGQCNIKWKPKLVNIESICARTYARWPELPHYNICKTFFEEGPQAALAIGGYTNTYDLQDECSLFFRRPARLLQKPIWWLMPWGGIRKRVPTNIEQRRINNDQAFIKFMNLLKSVADRGFLLKSLHNNPIPVHELTFEGQSVYIAQDGHHRLSLLSYLIDTHNSSTLQHQWGEPLRVWVSPEIKVDRQMIPHLSSVSRCGDDAMFTMSDAYAWFDLPFSVCKPEPNDGITSESLLHAKNSTKIQVDSLLWALREVEAAYLTA